MIPVNIRAAVYSAVAKNATDAEFESLFKVYRETDQHEEKRRVLRALGSVREESRLDRVLIFAIGDEVRIQDLAFVIFGAAESAMGRAKLWSFLQAKRELLVDRYANGLLISRMVSNYFGHDLRPLIHSVSRSGEVGAGELCIGRHGLRVGDVLQDQ